MVGATSPCNRAAAVSSSPGLASMVIATTKPWLRSLGVNEVVCMAESSGLRKHDYDRSCARDASVATEGWVCNLYSAPTRSDPSCSGGGGRRLLGLADAIIS